MNSELHTKKVTILSRLVKESTLTLEEALLLLQDEHEEETVKETPKSGIHYVPYTPYTGTTIFGGSVTAGTTFTTSSPTADLNT